MKLPVLMMSLSLLAAFITMNDSVAQIRPHKKPLKKTEHEQSGVEKGFGKALRKYKDGDQGRAEEILKGKLESQPDHVPSLLLAAEIAFENKDIDRAKRLAGRALELRPDNRMANLLAAKIAFALNRPVKALEFMKKASKSSADVEGMPVGQDVLDKLRMKIKESLRAGKDKPVDHYVSTDAHSNQVSTGLVLPEERKFSIAVFQFELGQGFGTDSSLGAVISEMMTTSFVQTGCFRVVERGQLNKIVEEQDLQMSDISDQETATQVGELMGVQAVIVGAVSVVGDKTEIDCRLVNVTTGQILSASNASAKIRDDLRETIDGMVISLARETYK